MSSNFKRESGTLDSFFMPREKKPKNATNTAICATSSHELVMPNEDNFVSDSQIDNQIQDVWDTSKMFPALWTKEQVIEFQKKNSWAKLANNLDLTGIPKTTNENLKLVVSTLAKIVNVEVKEEHINKTYRLRHKNEDNSRIIVEFTNKEIKNNLLTAIKSRVKSKMPLIAKEIHKNFSKNHIYVNEQLSVVNRKIYWLAKQIAKKYNYEYVWANGSGVFLKKAEGMYGVRICNLSQLMSIDTEKSIDQLWIRN
ncbi:uncharacterized protein LOC115034739 [Acyrthosiphon pisum]|uniref:FP protein C-terminal domain-containing protein n=1 Tax=Acyrthosiphon pisum TaxID=7029 RepID=A0A8R2NTY0_ACYPI|nr:uncharacterized protein LOC115034739 [Acyrthosiphon pisum]